MNIIRYLQGERRGMGSELRRSTPGEVTLLGTLREAAPTILIQTSVQLADVSFWQDLINFEVMRNAGLSGVIIRAGQRNWPDSKFSTNWQKARAAGIPRGSYWFYDSRDTPRNQALLWSSLLGSDHGELCHAADFEESYGGLYGTKQHLKDFINYFQDFTGLPDRRIANYTGFFWWQARVGNDLYFRRFNLWLAWYAAMANVRVPAPWTDNDLLFWQYTSSGNGTAYGVSSQEIDLNWFYGSTIEYKQRFSLETPPEPPPGGTVEDKYFKVTASALNIRSTPENLGLQNDIGDLVKDDIVHAVEVVTSGGVTWHRIEPKVYRLGMWANLSVVSPTGKLYAAEKGTSVWMAETGNPTPDGGDPDFITAHWTNGTTKRYIPE